MKKYKIYVKGNYIVVVDVLRNEYFYGTKKEVFVDKSNVNKNTYKIFNVKQFNNETILQIPNILKEDGTAYSEAEFDTFYQENTGNFNGGGLAPEIMEALNNVTSVNYTNPIDTDSLLTFDVTNSIWKRLTYANIKANLKTYFDSIYTTQSWVNSQGFITNVITALGYTPENSANKSTSVITDSASNTKYPSVKAVFDWANSVFTTPSAVATQITTAINSNKTSFTYNILVSNWTLVSGKYEAVISNAGILADSFVDVIPSNDNVDIVRSAQIYPSVLISAGSVKVYSKFLPSGTISVTVNIN